MLVDINVTVSIGPDGEGFHVWCPALPGLHVGGDTMQEAFKNAEDAVYVYIHSVIEHGEPLPPGVKYVKAV